MEASRESDAARRAALTVSWAPARRVGDTLSLFRANVEHVREHDVPFMAGGLAYAAFVSLLPLLVLLLLVASALGGRQLGTYLVEATGAYLTPAGQRLLVETVTRAAGRAELSVIGIVVLGWGMLKGFRGLDTAFSRLYGTREDPTFRTQVRDGIVALAAVAAALLVMIGAGAAVALFPHLSFLRVVNPVVLVAGLTLAFLPIYYVFPDADVSVREVLPGAVVAAVGWAGLEAGFGLYVAYSSTAQLYGAVGAVVLFVTWLYFGALVLLVGVVTNLVLADRGRTASATARSKAA